MPDEAVAQMRSSPLWPALEAVAPTIAYDNAVMGDGTVPHGQGRPNWHSDARHRRQPELRGAPSRGSGPSTKAIPRARYRDLEGQSHAATPESLAPLLKEFLL